MSLPAVKEEAMLVVLGGGYTLAQCLRDAQACRESRCGVGEPCGCLCCTVRRIMHDAPGLITARPERNL
jgi:hypothetical protein